MCVITFRGGCVITQFYAEAQSMNFRGYIILQIFDFLQLISYKLDIFIRIYKKIRPLRPRGKFLGGGDSAISGY